MKLDLRRRSTGSPSAYIPGVDHAAVVPQVALLVDDGNVAASCSRAETRSPTRSTGSRRFAGRSASRDDSGARVGSKRSGRRRRPSPLGARPLVERVEQALHLQIGEREHVPQPAREQRAAVAHGGEAPHELDADRGERVEIERRARACRRAAATAAAARASGRRFRRTAGSTRPSDPSTRARRARDTSAADGRARRRTASPAAPSGGSRRRAARRSPTRRRPARRRPAAGTDCGSRTA